MLPLGVFSKRGKGIKGFHVFLASLALALKTNSYDNEFLSGMSSADREKTDHTPSHIFCRRGKMGERLWVEQHGP